MNCVSCFVLLFCCCAVVAAASRMSYDDGVDEKPNMPSTYEFIATITSPTKSFQLPTVFYLGEGNKNQGNYLYSEGKSYDIL